MREDPRRVPLCGAMGPLSAVRGGDRLTSYDHSTSDQGHYEQDEEDHEEDLGEFSGDARDATEAECSCDQSNQQKNQRVV